MVCRNSPSPVIAVMQNNFVGATLMTDMTGNPVDPAHQAYV
jgi:hypothetical protein